MKKTLPKGRQHCAWPNCPNEGSFPAPCDPLDLRKRVYLCPEHIKQYNKAWNGLEGFSAEEIFTMQDNPSWDKPTWELGKKQKLQEGIFAFTHGRDKSGFKGFDYLGEEDFDFEELDFTEVKNKKPIQKAMELLEIEEPLDLKKLKKAYKKQVKLHHPDRMENKIEAEEKLKKINLAYHSLQKYLGK